MGAAFSYLVIAVVAVLLAGAFGFLMHLLRAWMAVDENPYRIWLLDGTWFERKVLGAKFDERFAWDPDHGRNIAIMVLSPMVVVAICAGFLWPRRGEVVTGTCELLTTIGLSPVICV